MRLRALRAGVFGSAISFWRVASHFEGIWINALLKRYLDWNALASRREFSSSAMFSGSCESCPDPHDVLSPLSLHSRAMSRLRPTTPNSSHLSPNYRITIVLKRLCAFFDQ
jgi:hypothetical protein